MIRFQTRSNPSENCLANSVDRLPGRDFLATKVDATEPAAGPPIDPWEFFDSDARSDLDDQGRIWRRRILRLKARVCICCRTNRNRPVEHQNRLPRVLSVEQLQFIGEMPIERIEHVRFRRRERNLIRFPIDDEVRRSTEDLPVLLVLVHWQSSTCNPIRRIHVDRHFIRAFELAEHLVQAELIDWCLSAIHLL